MAVVLIRRPEASRSARLDIHGLPPPLHFIGTRNRFSSEADASYAPVSARDRWLSPSTFPPFVRIRKLSALRNVMFDLDQCRHRSPAAGGTLRRLSRHHRASAAGTADGREN
jgi:hypothetical protein